MGFFSDLKAEKEKLKNEIYTLQKNKEQISNELKSLIEEKKNLSNDIDELSSKKLQLDRQLASREDFFVNSELRHIDTLEGLEFENYSAQLLQKLGYSAEVTKASQDNGGDILATKDGIKYVIQCKNYSSTVGNKAIQEVYAAKGIYKCDKAIVLTNNFFTKQAQDEAEILDIMLWDRESLFTLLYQSYNFDLSLIDIHKLPINKNGNEYNLLLLEEDCDDLDPFLNDAIDFAFDMNQISASLIQRKFKIGYARAGRIIDQMEEKGIISGYQGSQPRNILITKEKWEEIKKTEEN